MFECGLARCWTGGNRIIDTGSHCLLLLLLLLRRASLTGRRRCAALKSISLVQLVFPSRATRATRSLFPLRCLSKLVKPKSSGGGCSNVRFHQKCPKLRFKESAFKFAYQQQHITDQLKVAIYSQLLSLSPSSSVCLSISLSLSHSICPSVPSWLSGNPLRPTTKRALNASCKVLSNTHPHTRIVCALLSVPHTHTHPHTHKYPLRNTHKQRQSWAMFVHFSGIMNSFYGNPKKPNNKSVHSWVRRVSFKCLCCVLS